MNKNEKAIDDMRVKYTDGGHQDDFLEKSKMLFDIAQGSACIKFQVCIIFRCDQIAPYRQTELKTHIYTSKLKKTHSCGF